MDSDKYMTKGVKILLGDPKKAILKLSAPMMLAMLLQALYNIADGIWVAGLGADQLAAVGLFFPFFIIIIALGAGIGVGGSSAISRRIGEGNKKVAENTAAHTILFAIGVAIVISIAALPFTGSLFRSLSGNGEVGRMAADYARILFAGAPILVFSHIAGAILRGEGAAKQAMYGLAVGSCLNIVLDPLFIYGFKLGVLGAAWATLISIAISAGLFSYWLFIQKKIYLRIKFTGFKPDMGILREILSVGFPSSLAQLSMSAAMIMLNIVVIQAGGTDGVAVFTSGWRIVMLGTIPLLGMATGVVAVTGAAFGAKNKEKLRTAYLYAVKIGILIELSVGILVAIFAGPISYIFSYSEGSSRIQAELTLFLRIVAILYPTVPLGMLTSAMFRGIGKGTRSLIVTILRTIILQVPISYLLGITFGLGLNGVWIGIVTANLIAVSITFSWGKYTVEHVIDSGRGREPGEKVDSLSL
ncbi:MAG: MATE family efflux transporter [Candidatus Aminicenantes bacterium]|jgi:putative MATE family efflux protein